jgi:hypothetical protein
MWTSWALNKAKKKKAAALYELEYAAKLRREIGFEPMNYDQLKRFVVANNNVIFHDEEDCDKKLEAAKKEFKSAGKEYFFVDKFNQVAFEQLCMYYSHDPMFEREDESYSLLKGVLLRGGTGTGKTRLMKLFMMNSYKPYIIMPCRLIADEYAKNGIDSQKQYSTMIDVYPQQNLGHNKRGYCYDDFGAEEDKNLFGNKLNVMQDLILKIYDNRLFPNTSMTTNLGGDEIEQYYGLRVRSRLSEMYNVIDMPEDAPDRRRL